MRHATHVSALLLLLHLPHRPDWTRIVIIARCVSPIRLSGINLHMAKEKGQELLVYLILSLSLSLQLPLGVKLCLIMTHITHATRENLLLSLVLAPKLTQPHISLCPVDQANRQMCRYLFFSVTFCPLTFSHTFSLSPLSVWVCRIALWNISNLLHSQRT